MVPEYLKVRLAQKRRVAEHIIEFRFDAADGSPLPAPSPGDHIEILTPSGQARCYSTTEDLQGAQGRWTIAIALDPAGSGGSASMHAQATVGDIMRVRPPTGNFPFTVSKRALFIAGGIGITPIRSMYNSLRRQRKPYEFVYLASSKKEAAYLEEFTDDPHTTVHLRNEHDRRFDLWNVLQEPGERDLFCCGPVGLMNQVRALTMHWRPSRIHFEDFGAVSPLNEFSAPFSALWAPTGELISVPAEATLLDALRAAGIDWPSSCNAGTCGTCKLTLLAGDADHRDVVLTEDERATLVTPCVSRGDGVLELGPL
ncbi:PDR/VanB family oxidoreductase [Arthrobacter sp. NPDC056727]|uniref:PDR/VanB family oxidoreductase n=1 Tax=Arthrobacter sp. NPDC056727 TaxID=3345927 RepID=UPI00366FACCF